MKNIIKFYIEIIVISVTLASGCKKEKVPIITTTPVSNLTATTATSGGNITDEGNSSILSRGVCWSTGTSPTISDSKTSDGTNDVSFSSSIIGLNAATVYFVRAYATNSAGTGYGIAISFTTLGQIPSLMVAAATNITATGAKLNGSVNANYLSTVVTFEFGKTTSYGSTITATQSPVTGNTITNFSADITGLSAGTIYHYRIKAVNSLGTTYGSDFTFATLGQTPTIITTGVTSITSTTAIINGNITSNGGSTITKYGICIGPTTNPTIEQNGYSFRDDNGIGPFTMQVTNLLVGITYHVRAFATNTSGTSYGNDVSFKTSTTILATVSTIAATSISANIASSGGNIISDGGGNIIERGICYSTVNNEPTIADNKIICGNGTGSFTANMTGLDISSTYFIRAYAINSEGIAYGNQTVLKAGNYICTGNGWEGASTYDPTRTGIHPIISSNSILPTQWRPSSSSMTELVACDVTIYVNVQSCLYSNGYTVHRYRESHNVTIREAKTGNIIAQNSFTGSEPDYCPSSIHSYASDIYGYFDNSLIINWIQNYVIK